MKSLCDYKGDDAFEVLADILEDAGEIMADEKIQEKMFEPIIVLASAMLKYHREAVERMLYRLNPDVKKTDINGSNLNAWIVKFINDITGNSAVNDFFDSQGQNEIEESSGSATESTKAKKK